MGESNYMVYLETKKRYHSIFAKFHQELKLLESVVKTLSGKNIDFQKNTAEYGMKETISKIPRKQHEIHKVGSYTLKLI